MLIWCIILMILGGLAFFDTLYNYGEVFRRVNSVVFMLVSLGLLFRVSLKIKMRRFEGLIAKVEQLETELARFREQSPKDIKNKEFEKISS